MTTNEERVDERYESERVIITVVKKFNSCLVGGAGMGAFVDELILE